MNKPSEWDIKYLREQGFWAFKDMMGAYGQIWADSLTIDGDFEKFLKDSEKIFDLALKMTRKAYLESKDMPQSESDKLAKAVNDATSDAGNEITLEEIIANEHND